MIDGSEPSGWWQASDGKWYPPETSPTSPPAAVGPPPAAVAGDQPTGPATVPTAEAAADPGKVSFDKHGWIKVDDPTPTPTAPPANSGRGSAVVMVLAIIAAVVVVGGAAVTFIPRNSPRPTNSAADNSDAPVGSKAADGSDDVHPLTLDSVLGNINVRFSDVGDGYDKVIDGSIDPLGGDGCAQPRRPFAAVGGTNWTAYNYRPPGFGGLAAGHLASAVTVFDHTADANKRLQQEKGADYQACLQRWDHGTWFEGSGLSPTAERMEPMPVSVPQATAIGWRYTAAVALPSGRSLELFTDHIIFTKGRVRVWVEVSSALGPFDQARRDLLVSRVSSRLDEALA